jgi:hypothetical protein
MAHTLRALGRNLLKQQKHGEAEPFLREWLQMHAQKGSEDWTTFNVKSMLGGALLGQKKYADAEPLLLQGYEGMKQPESKVPGWVKQAHLIETLERLVQLYDAWAKPDDTARWRAELAARRAPPKDEKKSPPKK